MTRKLHALLYALLLGGPLMIGCASILGDYEIVGGGGAGGASDASGVGGFPFTSSTSPITDGSASSGGGPIDPADMDPCGSGSTTSMKDYFNDSPNSPNWTIISPDGHIKAVQATSHLQITTDGANGINGGYQWASNARSLVGCHIAAQVNKVASASGSVETMFNLVTEADAAGTTNLMRISQNGSNIEVLIRIDAKEVLHYTGAFDPSSMVWWRMRERDGRVIFEVSQEANTWTQLTDNPAPPFISAIRPQLFVGATAPDSSGGTATFFNFNTN